MNRPFQTISYFAGKEGKKMKEQAWEEIRRALEGIGPVRRTVRELKRKRETFFSDVKMKVSLLFITDIYIFDSLS